jgi:diadenosine tetraphosphate (Ap4A) HIT family hydrolase
VELTSEKKYLYLIQEFEHSYLLLGEHQFFAGYCVLVSKKHYREMTDLPESMNQAFFQEMLKASKAIEKVFQPKKMNMCSLGNVVDHVHWHRHVLAHLGRRGRHAHRALVSKPCTRMFARLTTAWRSSRTSPLGARLTRSQ